MLVVHRFRLAKGPECVADLGGEDLRQFPRREVAAPVKLVVVDKFGIGSLCPTARGLVELVRKGADANWNLETFGSEEGKLAFQIQASRGDRRIRQPV